MGKIFKKEISFKKYISNALILGIPILIIPLIYSRDLIDPVLLPKFLAFAIYLIFFLTFIVIKYKEKDTPSNFAIINNRIFLWYILYIVITGISLSYTLNFSDGLFEWLKINLAFIFLFLIVIHCQNSEKFIPNIVKLIAVFSLIVSLIGIYQFFLLIDKSVLTHSTIYRISATFANKNLYSQILLLTLPFTIYGLLTFRGKFKLLCFTGSVLALWNITILLSRAVWIALIVGFVCTILFYIIVEYKSLRFKKIRFAKIRKGLMYLLTILMVITLSVILYSNYDTFETFQKQSSSTFNIQHSSTKNRIALWGKSYDLSKESYFTGIGLGSWKIEMLKFGTEGMKSEDGVTFYQRPHNDFIWVLAEAGILGLCFFALIFIFCFYYILRILRIAENRDTKTLCYLMFFGLILYLVCSFFSFPKERIEHTILLTFIMSPIIITYHNLNKSTQPKASWIKYCFPLAVFMLVLSNVVGYNRLVSEYHVRKAFDARNRLNWNKVIQNIDKAESFFYTMDPTSTPLRWYSGSAHFNLNHLEEAFVDFKRAYEIHPYHIHVLNNLATCYELFGNHNKAIELYEKAIEISPRFEDALLNLSTVYFNQGNLNKAYEVLRRTNSTIENLKFKTLITKILTPKIELLRNSVDEKILKSTLLRVQNSDSWIHDIHLKSVKNNISFDKQLLIDALYVLEIEDKNITFEEARTFKTKYNIK